ncbi:19582_t:CDS:2 [Gigaspora margarita]|uniref:19582_t:CDS:1 n=1 Tax=Gigaspora margarita TaxID=4874 RepID=A0ABN7UL41_GIGMA|nr:19582_t:CDS:2 [Gigaspora margarita]
MRVVPSEHSEPIRNGIDNTENDIGSTLHRPSNDYTSASVPPYPPYENGDESMDENDNSEDDEDEGPLKVLKEIKRKEDARRTPLQNKLHYFFEVPTSIWAKAYCWFSLTINLASISILCVDSIPGIMGRTYYERIWYCMDIAFVSFFTIEYIFRFTAASNKLKYLYQPSNVIDLISIIAMYIQIGASTRNSPSSQLGPALRFVGILRLFRIIKLFHISKYTGAFNFSSRILIRSAYQLMIGSIYAVIIIIVSSVFIYYAERGEFNNTNQTWYRVNENGQWERSPFQSVVHCFWWSVVTITTTGYGDVVPVTPVGKFIAGLTMSLGILAVALPTTIIGSNFMAEWSVRHRSRFQRRLRKSRVNLNSLSSEERAKVLKARNDLLVETILGAQDSLAEIIPPNYFLRYKTYKEKYRKACERISELENQLEKQKRFTNNFDNFIRKTKHNHQSDNSDSSMTDNSTDNGHDKWTLRLLPHFKKSRTISSLENSFNNNIYDASGNIDLDNPSETKLKIPKMFSIGTLKNKIRRTFSTDHDDSKSSRRKKKRVIENTDISAPTAARPIFTPINDKDNSAITLNPETIPQKRPPHRRNHSSPEFVASHKSSSGHSGDSVNSITNNQQRGIFLQDSNVNYPIPLINVDQNENSTSHSKKKDMDRIEILVDDMDDQ